MKFVVWIMVVVASLYTGCSHCGEGLRKHYLEMARTSVREGAYEQALEALSRIPVTLPPSREFYLIQGLS